LDFESIDIKYIIVAEDYEVNDMINFLKGQLEYAIPEEDLHLLFTRIKTAQQIREDY